MIRNRFCGGLGIGLLAVAVAAWISTTPAQAAQQPKAAAELTLNPAQVSLAAGEETRVVAVVEAGDAPLTGVRLEAVEVPGLSVEAESALDGSIEAGGRRAVDLLVRRDEGRGGASVPLRLTWRLQPEGGAGQSFVQVEVLQVTDAARGMAQVAKVEVESAIATIEDRRHGGMAYLVVENLTSYPLTVTGVRCYAPYFLEVRLRQPEKPPPTLWIAAAASRLWRTIRRADESGGAGTGDEAGGEAGDDEPPWSCGADALTLPTVEPGSSRVLPFQITADVVEPGKHTVAWEVELAWTRGGQRQSGVVVGSHEFTLAVLGESQLLTLFAWPSILVLPGALMLLTFVTLRQRVYPKEASNLSATDAARKGEFWLIAVALSFLTAIVYPVLTGQLGDPRDFIAVHGIDDIVNLWLGSMLAAVVAWAAWYGTKWAVAAGRRWHERRTVPQPGEDALPVLGKLRRAGRRDLLVETVTLTRDGTTQPALELYRVPEGDVWVGPPIVVLCRDDEALQSLQPLRDDAAKLPKALDKRLRSGEVLEVRWKFEAAMPRSIERVAGDVVQRPEHAPRRRLVDLETGEP